MAKINPAPGRNRVLTFATPKVGDLVFYETHDITLPEYSEPKEYGQPYPGSGYPDHVLVFISPHGDGKGHWSRWYYAAKRESQDDYNFELDGDTRLIRTYIVPRKEYLEGGFAEPAYGSADSSFSEFKYGSQDVKRIGQKELDSYFVVIRRNFLNDSITQSISESGSSRGETSSETTVGTTAAAEAVSSGIVLQRRSSLTAEELWQNTEEVLDLREGVNQTSVDYRPGVKTTRTSELSSTEPYEEGDDTSFAKDLVTTDADNADAVWKASRESRVSDPSTGEETTTQLGGGMVSVDFGMVDEDSSADQGLYVLSSQVTPIGKGDALKKTRTIDSFPTLTEEVYDESVSQFVRVTKDVIAAGSESGSATPGNITEIKPVDKWRSIKINTQYVTSPVGQTETFPIVDTYQYPPVLNSAEFQFVYAYATATGKSDYQEDLALVYDLSESYSTAVEGKVLRITTDDPETVADSYRQEVKTQLSSHTVSYLAAWFWASNVPPEAIARTALRTFQTPMAVIPNEITLVAPNPNAALITIDRQQTSTIPAGGYVPSGWTTVDIQTSRAKLGLFTVSVKQLNL
jgi:hypothetical protein